MADDPSIPGTSRLFRRIPAQRSFIVWNSNTQSWRLSSQAFRNQKGFNAFSVNLECVLQDLGLGPDAVVRDRECFALVALTAGAVRNENQAVSRQPEPDDPSHGHVEGDKPSSVAGRLADLAMWVIEPPGWPWPPP